MCAFFQIVVFMFSIHRIPPIRPGFCLKSKTMSQAFIDHIIVVAPEDDAQKHEPQIALL